MDITNVQIVNLPKLLDNRGNLTFIEEFSHIPFKIRRSYWIYDVPGGESRGGHAFKENQEFIIALSGSFEVVLDDAKSINKYALNRSYEGIYVPNGLWREMINFSTNSLALVLSSIPYRENDYIRNYDEFIETAKKNNVVPNVKSQIFKSEFHDNTLSLNKKTSVYDCTIIELNKHHSERKGNITVVENLKTVPFDIKRAYYLYDIPGGEERGAHAHKELYQLIIAASGSFDVVLDDGNIKRTFSLNRPYHGLLVVPGIWRKLNNFSSGAVCLVLASHKYDEEDYIRRYEEFVTYKNLLK